MAVDQGHPKWGGNGVIGRNYSEVALDFGRPILYARYLCGLPKRTGFLMRAIVCTGYGVPNVLQVQERPKPTPGDDEVLVEVYASSGNYGNVAHVRGEPVVARLWTGALRPKDQIPGSDIAGRVAAVDQNVTQFQPGDEVFGDSGDVGFGAYAEYVSVPANILVHKPTNLSFPEAAAVPLAALVALQALRNKGQVKPGLLPRRKATRGKRSLEWPRPSC